LALIFAAGVVLTLWLKESRVRPQLS